MNKYYYFDRTDAIYGSRRHIIRRLGDDAIETFPLIDGWQAPAEYLAWVAEGNTAEEWQPDGE